MGSGRNCAPESWWAVMPEKTLFVFAGPNGSGKSTVIGRYMTSGYITADSYVCPDNIVKHIRLKFPKYLISPLSDMGYVINMTCE